VGARRGSTLGTSSAFDLNLLALLVSAGDCDSSQHTPAPTELLSGQCHWQASSRSGSGESVSHCRRRYQLTKVRVSVVGTSASAAWQRSVRRVEGSMSVVGPIAESLAGRLARCGGCGQPLTGATQALAWHTGMMMSRRHCLRWRVDPVK
jgi:hypothetical protein